MPKEFVSGGCPGKVARRHDRGDHESLAVKLIDIVLVPRRIDLHEQLIPSTPGCLPMRNGEGAGDRRVTRRAGSVRIPTRRRLQRWRENTRRHEPRCVAVSVARGRDERNGHPAFRSPVLGRHNPIPPAAAPAWRAVGSAFGREFPCFRPGIEAEFDSLTLDRGRGIVCRFPRHYRPYEDPIVAMGPLAAPLSA